MSEEARGLGQKAVEGVERSTGLKVGEAVRSAEREREREREKSSRQEVETIGYVVEQKPVAEIVVPVGPAPPGDVKRMV